MVASGLDRSRLMRIFDTLFQRFGPQDWWPARNPFEVCVGAILVQSVAWRNVEQAIDALHRDNLMTCAALVDVPLDRLARCLVPTRFYRQKARRLQSFCRVVQEKAAGDVTAFLRGDTQAKRRELLDLHGIGEETADDILLYAGGHPVFVVDAYTRRIFHRLGHWEEKISYGQMQSVFMEHLPRDTALFNEYHALIDRLGSQVCRAKPKCEACPLVSACAYASREGESA